MPESQHPSMRLAEILSDLVSLRVCDPSAALALVSARPDTSSTLDAHNPTNTNTTQHPNSNPNPNADKDADDDVDLKRAKDLVSLHYEVKQAHKRGELGRGLEEARGGVERALGGLI